MDETGVPYWPEDVPETLWNYALMQARQPPPFPFMGLSFEPGFQVAFVAGLLFVCFFAWKRFKEKTFDSKFFTYRVLTELDLTVLRGGAAMRRAYLIYAGTLVVLYLGMTFFGKLILQTVGRLPIAGAQVDTSGLNFSSPQWPLMLAFGFAGLAPMLPPLEAAETWLRRRAHQVVGIPTRIDQLARRIIDNFERQFRNERTEADATAAIAAPAWVSTHLGSPTVLARIAKVREELRRFKEWSEEEDPDWPDRSVRSDLRRLEREIAGDARAILQEYDDVLRQPYDAMPGEEKASSEDLQARRKQLRHRLDVAVQRMTDLRNDLAAIIAVYAEGDREFDKINKPEHRQLREALTETFAYMRVRTGPEVALVTALPAIFLIYALACATELHPLLKPVQVTALTVGVTASLETLRFASILTLPSVAAFGLRFYLLDRASWNRTTHGRVPRLTGTERLLATALGVATAVALLSLVAMLWAAVLSPTSTHFQQLLFRSQHGFLVYFMMQAAISALVLFCALAACDVPPPTAVSQRRWIGVVCALLVLAWLLRSALLDGLQCANGLSFPSGLFDKTCFRDSVGLDAVIYPVAAFLACAVFGTSPQGAEPQQGGDAGTTARRRFAPEALPTAVALLVLALWASPAFSQACVAQPKCNGAGCPESCTVTIGFRADAEPFSFKVEADGRPHFEGYLADLCYAIFAGSPYEVRSVAVTVGDRFGRINGAMNPAAGTPVDVLCDPLTVRFSRPDQELRGFYSPIVFASGATYLLRKTGSARSVAYLGFAKNSTAELVAKKACQVDLLRIREPDEKPMPGECEPETDPAFSAYCEPAGPAPSVVTDRRDPNKEPAYVFCPMQDHGALIEWFCRSALVPKEKAADTDKETDTLDFHMAYVGDREIIQGKLAAYIKQPRHHCPEAAIEADPSNYTYEPYAMVVSLERPELAQFVQRRVYEYFSHPGNARGLFQKHFPLQQMSPALAYLYLLNGVMDRDPFTVQTMDEPSPSDGAPREDRPPEGGRIADTSADRNRMNAPQVPAAPVRPLGRP